MNVHDDDERAALRSLVQETAARTGFSGVVSVARGDEVLVEEGYGLAHRGHGISNRSGTRFATASGTKAFTALAVMRLIEAGVLTLDEPVRPWLGEDLPLIDDAVTIEHLLGHTSGIGDYFDEDEIALTDHVLTRPVHVYTDAESFLPDLDGHEQVFAPGTRYSYNNGGYLVLALIAERAGGRSYHDLVRAEVFEPAGMSQTQFLRSDRLPGDAALGYLEDDGDLTNVLHLPVVGGGDGGAYTSARDMRRFWRALSAGAVVRGETLAAMAERRHVDEDEGLAIGLGLYGHARGGPALVIEGCDAGVSFRSTHDPESGLTVSVLGNTTEGAWPMVDALMPLFDAP